MVFQMFEAANKWLSRKLLILTISKTVSVSSADNGLIALNFY